MRPGMRLWLGLMWLLHWLPLPLLAPLGRGLGLVFWLLVRERRHVALTNLGLCFPQLAEAEKSALARRHFMAFGRAMLELGLWWWASPARIRRLVVIEHGERLAAARGRPLILFAPHFVGLDAGWTRLTLEADMVTVYAKAKNPLFDAALRRGRSRFGHSLLVSRLEGVRKILDPLRRELPFYYLPDMDYGRKDAVFVPFFGIPAATITGLARLAELTGATVLPVITRQVGHRYVLSIGEAWADYPGEDIAAATRRMNAFLEGEIRRTPEQYLWIHKRFKTRPEGEKAVY
ncbi:MAG: lipid A biosynthesis acyltransferase [Betaproteobacteria bacterium HGW-Betaproteobacteria-11]|nr:MAG: lipid A biosynthesis acyltransferase [Betaproteobacteria bacterium HGW-Betaproteobacteria-11]